jgi:hypothetical protein
MSTPASTSATRFESCVLASSILTVFMTGSRSG